MHNNRFARISVKFRFFMPWCPVYGHAVLSVGITISLMLNFARLAHAKKSFDALTAVEIVPPALVFTILNVIISRIAKIEHSLQSDWKRLCGEIKRLTFNRPQPGKRPSCF